MWRIVQPVMFCLIGADLEFTATAVFNTRSVLVCVGLLLVAWLVGGVKPGTSLEIFPFLTQFEKRPSAAFSQVRIVVSMIVLSYGELSIRERLYVTLAWVPKAGVQVRSLKVQWFPFGTFSQAPPAWRDDTLLRAPTAVPEVANTELSVKPCDCYRPSRSSWDGCRRRCARWRWTRRATAATRATS